MSNEGEGKPLIKLTKCDGRMLWSFRRSQVWLGRMKSDTHKLRSTWSAITLRISMRLWLETQLSIQTKIYLFSFPIFQLIPLRRITLWARIFLQIGEFLALGAYSNKVDLERYLSLIILTEKLSEYESNFHPSLAIKAPLREEVLCNPYPSSGLINFVPCYQWNIVLIFMLSAYCQKKLLYILSIAFAMSLGSMAEKQIQDGRV